MTFNNESEVCEDYTDWATEEFTTEVTIGKDLTQEHVPQGLEGAKSPRIDAIGWRGENSSSPILVECKQSFDFTGIGQLLLYDWFLRQDSQPVEDGSTIQRRLILGERPNGVIIKACDDLDIEITAYIEGEWHTNFSIESESFTKSSSNKVNRWLEQQTSPSTDSEAESELIREIVQSKLKDITLQDTYYELPVGRGVFPKINPSFKADSIGYASDEGVYYVIEAKGKADIQQFCKAIGQATAYSSLFRHSFGLPVEQVIPTVLLDGAPLHAKIYRNQYNHMREMMKDAVFQSDQFLLLYNKVELFQ